MTQSIADLPWDDRPRERMIQHGASTLSNAELIAILLGSGFPGKNALDVARDLLVEGLDSLSRRDVSSLARVNGIGTAKAARIVAAFEFALRYRERVIEEAPPYHEMALAKSLIPKYANRLQEHLGAVFLDTRDRILRQREIFIGTTKSALVSTRDIVRLAMEGQTCGVVLYHNHPSRSPTPSPDDIAFTKKAKQALELVDVTLVDHLVIGGDSYVSMNRAGMLS
jgi:DNA repair protein RadC